MKRPNKALRAMLILLLIALVAVNAWMLLGDMSFSNQQDETQLELLADQEERAQLREALSQINIGAGIRTDGMSVDRGAVSAVEIGIVDCDVYCKDKYQIVPIRGENLAWSSDNESIATVDENGLVRTHKAGRAVITATDSSGNTDTCAINVIKVAYVTIDDTPTKYTPKLLDILDEYGVKATFFMNADPDEADQYAEIYKRGHTFALHGYTHYTKYDDGEDFLDNMEKARQFIMESSGCDSIDDLIRFPTGSKGMKNYRQILEYIQSKGYRAFDWTTEFHDYYYHYPEGCLEYYKTYLTTDRAVILFHPRKWSVEALPEALDYLFELGYTTAVITQDTAEHNFYGLYPD